MKLEFREQKIEFIIGVDDIFYRITFKRGSADSPWVFELFDILKDKIVYMSKVDKSIYPDPGFASDIIMTFISRGDAAP
ncbi:MAG: hypothetical protein GY859_33140 [Desulfobacterales bacterium]|nr:hypothetical protein [Desulfobacterales bacterium]